MAMGLTTPMIMCLRFSTRINWTRMATASAMRENWPIWCYRAPRGRRRAGHRHRYPAASRPAEGALVQLFSSEPWMVDLPQYVVIPPGARTTSFQFPVTALNLEPTKVVVYASYGADYVETELTIGPARTFADLSLSMVAAADPVGLGDVVTYTIEVTNQGPESVTGVTLTDTLPDGAVLKSATGVVSEQVPGPGLHVRFDYTHDTSGFFDTQEKKDLLQLAGDVLVGAMGDDLEAIIPGAGNTWTADLPQPGDRRRRAYYRFGDTPKMKSWSMSARGTWATRGRACGRRIGRARQSGSLGNRGVHSHGRHAWPTGC